MPENTDIKSDTKFKPGQSGNPAGKPKGIKHRATQAVQALLEGELEALTRKAVECALAGDMIALKLCLDRIAPPLKPMALPVELGLPECNASLADTARVFVEAAARGKIPPDIAAQMVSAVASAAKIEEMQELKYRLEALERAMTGASA